MEILLLSLIFLLIVIVIYLEFWYIQEVQEYATSLLQEYEDVSTMYETSLTALARRTDLTHAEAKDITAFLVYCDKNKKLFRRERFFNKKFLAHSKTAYTIYHSCLKSDDPISADKLDELKKSIFILPHGDLEALSENPSTETLPPSGWILKDRERAKALSLYLTQQKVEHSVFNSIDFDS